MAHLLIDTSTKRCAVFIRVSACASGEAVAPQTDFQIDEAGTRGQDSRLAPMVQEALAKAGIAAHDLTHIGVIIGPGAFTGVRIGVAFARGLALALGKSAMGINALDVFALNDMAAPLAAGVCDIGRGELAFRLARNGILQGDYETAGAEDVMAQIGEFGDAAPVVLAGSAATAQSGEGLRDSGQSALSLSRAMDLWQANALPVQDALPWYHRPPDAKLPGGITP